MWQLRLIIILIGLVFIALVYLLSRQRKGMRAARKRDEPSLNGVENVPVSTDTDSFVELPVEQENTPTLLASTTPQGTAQSRQLIVVLHVTGRDAVELQGGKVLAALRANGLQYGQMHIFHRMTGQDDASTVFSVANMVEPGELQPETLDQQQIAGLTLFLVLPGPADAVAACADMIATARALATQLQGEVQNENRTPFTIEDAQRIRQRVLEFQTSA